MIPISGIDFETGVNVKVMPNKTYGLLEVEGDNGITQAKGFVDGMASIRQAIYKVLKTERDVYAIYNSDYGINLRDLIGKSKVYVSSQIEQRVREALLMDSRVKGVHNFLISEGENKGEMYISFDVYTTEGEENISMEVVL